jgi:hypothetical protein
MTTEQPKMITVSRSFTYDLDDIQESWLETNPEPMSYDELMDMAMSYAREDLVSPITKHDLTIHDPYTGEEI